MRRDFARSIAGRQAVGQTDTIGTSPGRAPMWSAHRTPALAALAVRHGEADLAGLRGPARELFDTLTNEQLRVLADYGRSDGDVRIGTSGGAAPPAR